MNRKAFIRKFSVGVFASAMLVDALIKDIFAYTDPEPKFGENVWNVMLTNHNEPNRLYKTILEAYEDVSTPSVGNEIILASGCRWV